MTEFSNAFTIDTEFDDIEVLGLEDDTDTDTPVALVPSISITTEPDTKRPYSPQDPNLIPGFDSQDSITGSMENRGRPLSVSEMRGNNRHKPPPRSQTMGEDRSRYYRRKVEHPHLSIKVSPQLNKKRMSFLYRPQGADLPGSQSRSQSLMSNSSFKSALYDNFLTPFARVLMHMKHIKEGLYGLEKNLTLDEEVVNNNNCEETNRRHVNSSMLIQTCIQGLEECLELVESLESGKSIGESAGDRFRQILQMELQHMGPSPANARVAEWVVSEFVEQDNDINSFVSNSEMEFGMNPVEKERKMSGLANSVSAPLLDINGRRTSAIPKPLSVKCDIRNNIEVLTFLRENITNWDMNIFKVNQLSNGYPLTATAYVIFQTHDLFNKCKIDETTFLRYLGEIENAYRDNPYHNGLHAADVVFNANILLSCDTIISVLQDWMILGLIIAAAIHDCDHPGRTNKFLINTKNDLALTYNDESILENHHCATGFRLLKESKNNIFANFSIKAYSMTRRLIIDLVLATDMNKHLGIIGRLKTTIESFKAKETEELELSSSNFSDILHSLLHCADLANPAKPKEIAIEWSRKIEEESYRQGDEERNIGLEVSHMCDRENPIFEKNQYTFLTFVALPLWEAWSELVYPNATIMLDHLLANKDYWESIQPDTPIENENEIKTFDNDPEN